MKHLFAWLVAAFILASSLPLSAKDEVPWRPEAYHSLFTEAERDKPYVYGHSYSLEDWPFIDGQWEGIVCDSDGNVWFGVSSHSFKHHAQLFRYNAAAGKVEHVADIGQACGEKLSGNAPQDKIHSQMFEDGEAIYCGTCEGHFSETIKYPGGYWLDINRKTGQVTALGKSISNDGLICVGYDRKNKLLYGHTNVKGELLSFNPTTRQEKLLGVPEKGGPAKWPRGLTLMIDPEGVVYGVKPPACTFWKYDPQTGQISDLAVKPPLPADVAAGDQKAVEKYNQDGRVAMTIWDEKDQCFYAMRGHDEMLLRFYPPRQGQEARVEALQLMGLSEHRYGQRYSSCMMALHDRTIWYTPYTGWGGVTYLTSYNLDTKKFTNHGPLIVDGDRRVNECHSIVAGKDGRLYMVCFVFSIEGVDPARENAMRDIYPFHPRFVIVDPRTDLKARVGAQ